MKSNLSPDNGLVKEAINCIEVKNEENCFNEKFIKKYLSVLNTSTETKLEDRYDNFEVFYSNLPEVSMQEKIHLKSVKLLSECLKKRAKVLAAMYVYARLKEMKNPGGSDTISTFLLMLFKNHFLSAPVQIISSDVLVKVMHNKLEKKKKLFRNKPNYLNNVFGDSISIEMLEKFLETDKTRVKNLLS